MRRHWAVGLFPDPLPLLSKVSSERAFCCIAIILCYSYFYCVCHIRLYVLCVLLHYMLSLAAQCTVIGPVCLWVCYHDNSELCTLILTKLGL